MKTQFTFQCPSASRENRHGSAVFIVIILLAIISGLMIARTISLRKLQREIKLIEKQQMKKYAAQKPAPRQRK